jgi:hypothetical protein
LDKSDSQPFPFDKLRAGSSGLIAISPESLWNDQSGGGRFNSRKTVELPSCQTPSEQATPYFVVAALATVLVVRSDPTG